MMRNRAFGVWILGFLLAGLWNPAAAVAEDAGLVGLLTQKLGVSEPQAQGGAGAIFQLAKQNLGAEDFAGIEQAVPGMGGMLAAAPQLEENSGLLGGLSSLFGGGSKKLEGMSALAGSFEKLGLKSEMVGMFMPIVLDYVKEKGGEQVMNVLKGALN